jgi:hypothetical protein
MPVMAQPHDQSRTPADIPTEELPERLCTWCKVSMSKRLVGGGLYIHYTCPKCVFQHTSKRQPDSHGTS